MDISLRAKSPALIGQSNIAALRRGSRRCGPGRSSVESLELRVGPPPAAGVRTGGYPPSFPAGVWKLLKIRQLQIPGTLGVCKRLILKGMGGGGQWPVAGDRVRQIRGAGRRKTNDE